MRKTDPGPLQPWRQVKTQGQPLDRGRPPHRGTHGGGGGVGGQQGTGRLHVTPDRVSTVVSQEGHRTAVHGPPLGQTRVRRPCSPRGAEEAAQVPAPPRKTRPHRTARRVPSGRPRAQLPPCAAGAPGAHGEDSGHAHTQPLFHALEGNVCGGKVVFRVHGLHPLSERASGRRIRRRRPRAGPSGRPRAARSQRSAPCSRPAAPTAPQVPGDQAAPPRGAAHFLPRRIRPWLGHTRR